MAGAGKKISALPSISAGDATDKVPAYDASGVLTGSFTLTVLGAYLDGIIDLKDAPAATGAITLQPGAGTNLNVTLSTTGDFAVNTDDLYVDTSSSYVGINCATPSYQFQVTGDWAVVSGNTISNSTNKHFRIGAYHYTIAEEPVFLAYMFNDSTDNTINIGGGTTTGNAATRIKFYTAANNTTVTGTEAMRIDSAGFVGVGTTSPDYRFQAEETTNGIGAMEYKNLSTGTAAAAQCRVASADAAFALGVNATTSSAATIYAAGEAYLDVNTTATALNFVNSGSIPMNFRIGGRTSASNRMVITTGGNVCLGGLSAAGTSAASVIAMKNGTAPTSSPADSIQLYAEDVAASSELKVRDEATNITVLSPHPHDAPDAMYYRGRGIDHFTKDTNMYLGRIEWFNLTKFQWDDSATKKDCRLLETFDEYNARMKFKPGNKGFLVKEDFDANQELIAKQRDAEIEKAVAINAARDEKTEKVKVPDRYTKKQKPDWLVNSTLRSAPKT